MNFKGQGTIEYLVIIGVVVTISLVTVGLSTQVLDSGSDIPETSAKMTWKSAQPFAVVDWKMGTDGKMIVVLKNMSYETAGFNYFNLTTTDGNSDSAINVSAGATHTITISVDEYASGCPAGTKYSFNKTGVTIDYNSKHLTNKTEKGVESILGTCS